MKGFRDYRAQFTTIRHTTPWIHVKGKMDFTV